jgi:hypothetical protein
MRQAAQQVRPQVLRPARLLQLEQRPSALRPVQPLQAVPQALLHCMPQSNVSPNP